MYLYLGLILTFFSWEVWASRVITTQIQEIDFSKDVTEETLVFLKSGHVAKLPKNDPALAAIIMNPKNRSSWFNLTLNDKREIIAGETAQSPSTQSFPLPQLSTDKIEKESYIPSVLGSLDWARKYFYESRYNSKESQCFNRAHVWTHDWRVKHNLYSMKVFIFFTRKYIRKYNFEWWFHVSPMVHVIVDGKVVERVMDIKYSRGPLKLKDWTDIFMKDNYNCPVVSSYSDYADWPESGSCFLLRSSMYYYQPLDLENFEKFGYEKNRWVESEVRGAYVEAFDMGI